MTTQLKQPATTQEWKALFPEQGCHDYILEHNIAVGELRHRFTRNVNVEIRKSLYGGFSRSVAVRTRSLEVNMEGPAAGHARLARKLAGVYDLLLLEITHEGTILKIKNIKQIRERWQTIQQQVQDEYDGDEVFGRLQVVDDMISDEQQIIDELHQLHFLGLLFGGWYQGSTDQSKTSQERAIEFLPTPITVAEQHRLDETDEKRNEIMLGVDAEWPEDTQMTDYRGRLTFNTETDWITRGQLKFTKPFEGQSIEHAFMVTQIQDQ